MLPEDLPGFSSYVEREMGAVVNTVKVLQSKPENLVETFMLLMPAQSQTAQQFHHLCEMKVEEGGGGEGRREKGGGDRRERRG